MIDTDEVRRAYQVAEDPHEDLTGETKFYAGEDFDAWLREEKAKAWDEGHRHCFHVENPKAEKPYNPYRRKNENR